MLSQLAEAYIAVLIYWSDFVENPIFDKIGITLSPTKLALFFNPQREKIFKW